MEFPGTVRDGVRFCDKLFRIEERLEKAASEKRLQVCQAESRPIVEEFYAWLDTLLPGHRTLKDAMTYFASKYYESFFCTDEFF